MNSTKQTDSQHLHVITYRCRGHKTIRIEGIKYPEAYAMKVIEGEFSKRGPKHSYHDVFDFLAIDGKQKDHGDLRNFKPKPSGYKYVGDVFDDPANQRSNDLNKSQSNLGNQTKRLQIRDYLINNYK